MFLESADGSCVSGGGWGVIMDSLLDPIYRVDHFGKGEIKGLTVAGHHARKLYRVTVTLLLSLLSFVENPPTAFFRSVFSSLL
jgi:hypothetical protein